MRRQAVVRALPSRFLGSIELRLNAVRGALCDSDERRKAVKREYTKPLSAFEGECKRIIGIAKGRCV